MHSKDLGADSEDMFWILDSKFKVLGYLSFDDHNPDYYWYYLHQTLINGASYDTYTQPVLNAESHANIYVLDAVGFQVKVLGAGVLCWPYLSFFLVITSLN